MKMLEPEEVRSGTAALSLGAELFRGRLDGFPGRFGSLHGVVFLFFGAALGYGGYGYSYLFRYSDQKMMKDLDTVWNSVFLQSSF